MLGVYLQIFPVNYAKFFLSALGVQVHPLHPLGCTPWLRLRKREDKEQEQKIRPSTIVGRHKIDTRKVGRAMHCNFRPPDVAPVVLFNYGAIIQQPTNSTLQQQPPQSCNTATHQILVQLDNPRPSY